MTPEEFVKLCEDCSMAVNTHNRMEGGGGRTEINEEMRGGRAVEVLGSVDLRGKQTLTYLPRAIIKGDLVIEGCRNLEVLDMDVEGSVKAAGSGIKKVPVTFRCKGDLDLTNTKSLRELEGDVGGNVFINGSQLQETGPLLHTEGTLVAGGCHFLEKVDGKFKGGAIIPSHGVKVAENIESWEKEEFAKTMNANVSEPKDIPANVIQVDFKKLARSQMVENRNGGEGKEGGKCD